MHWARTRQRSQKRPLGSPQGHLAAWHAVGPSAGCLQPNPTECPSARRRTPTRQRGASIRAVERHAADEKLTPSTTLAQKTTADWTLRVTGTGNGGAVSGPLSLAPREPKALHQHTGRHRAGPSWARSHHSPVETPLRPRGRLLPPFSSLRRWRGVVTRGSPGNNSARK